LPWKKLGHGFIGHHLHALLPKRNQVSSHHFSQAILYWKFRRIGLYQRITLSSYGSYSEHLKRTNGDIRTTTNHTFFLSFKEPHKPSCFLVDAFTLG
jgi:hypothetical protein